LLTAVKFGFSLFLAALVVLVVMVVAVIAEVAVELGA
jgi:hypothetical protein